MLLVYIWITIVFNKVYTKKQEPTKEVVMLVAGARDDRQSKSRKSRRDHSISSVSIKKHKVSLTDGSVWKFIDRQ